MTILADTSFIFSVIDDKDRRHTQARAFYYSVKETLLLPVPVLPELTYLVEREWGTSGVVNTLRLIRQSKFEIIDPILADYDRVIAILDKYSDSRIDFVDACLMAIAERLKITSILTFDRRDFGMYRPTHLEHFDLLP